MEKQAFKRKPVESSNIASIGHSFPRRMLEVEFKNGSIYRYKGVNNKTYKALLSADSKGKAFYSMVRGKYPYKKVLSKDGDIVKERYKEANYMGYGYEKTAHEELDEMVKWANIKTAHEELDEMVKEALYTGTNPIRQSMAMAGMRMKMHGQMLGIKARLLPTRIRYAFSKKKKKDDGQQTQNGQQDSQSNQQVQQPAQ